jgi:hypothetical protein
VGDLERPAGDGGVLEAHASLPPGLTNPDS